MNALIVGVCLLLFVVLGGWWGVLVDAVLLAGMVAECRYYERNRR